MGTVESTSHPHGHFANLPRTLPPHLPPGVSVEPLMRQRSLGHATASPLPLPLPLSRGGSVIPPPTSPLMSPQPARKRRRATPTTPSSVRAHGSASAAMAAATPGTKAAVKKKKRKTRVKKKHKRAPGTPTTPRTPRTMMQFSRLLVSPDPNSPLGRCAKRARNAYLWDVHARRGGGGGGTCGGGVGAGDGDGDDGGGGDDGDVDGDGGEAAQALGGGIDCLARRDASGGIVAQHAVVPCAGAGAGARAGVGVGVGAAADVGTTGSMSAMLRAPSSHGDHHGDSHAPRWARHAQSERKHTSGREEEHAQRHKHDHRYGHDNHKHGHDSRKHGHDSHKHGHRHGHDSHKHGSDNHKHASHKRGSDSHKHGHQHGHKRGHDSHRHGSHKHDYEDSRKHGHGSHKHGHGDSHKHGHGDESHRHRKHGHKHRHRAHGHNGKDEERHASRPRHTLVRSVSAPVTTHSVHGMHGTLLSSPLGMAHTVSPVGGSDGTTRRPAYANADATSVAEAGGANTEPHHAMGQEQEPRGHKDGAASSAATAAVDAAPADGGEGSAADTGAGASDSELTEPSCSSDSAGEEFRARVALSSSDRHGKHDTDRALRRRTAYYQTLASHVRRLSRLDGVSNVTPMYMVNPVQLKLSERFPRPVTVYRAHVKGVGHDCVVKVLGRDWAADAEVQAHLELAKVPRARVVPLERPPLRLACGRHALVMRNLCPAFGSPSTLSEFLQRTMELFDALDAWHERGWVHCDLKSENMGVDPSGSLFLFDLGLAVKLDTPASLKPMGGPVGTAALMAPELANEADGHLLSTAADVYSACTCVRELLEHADSFTVAAPAEAKAKKRLLKLLRKGRAKREQRPTARAIANTVRQLLGALQAA